MFGRNMATISLSYLVICLLVWEPQTKAASIPLCWSKCIATICKSFDQVSPCTLHHVPLDKNALLEPHLFLMPPVMIWSPLEQFHSQLVNGLLCPTCEDAQPLQPHGWRDGSKERLEPRKIHGIAGTILLVGRIYKCTKGHESVGYNPKILEQIPLLNMVVPFCLWHKTGFSRQFMDMIVGMVSSGISISETHKFTQIQFCNQYWKGKSHFEELKNLHGMEECPPFPAYVEWETECSSSSPSWHSIARCFMFDFWSKEKLYTCHTQLTSIDSEETWLSCDHTFASAGMDANVLSNYFCMQTLRSFDHCSLDSK